MKRIKSRKKRVISEKKLTIEFIPNIEIAGVLYMVFQLDKTYCLTNKEKTLLFKAETVESLLKKFSDRDQNIV